MLTEAQNEIAGEFVGAGAEFRVHEVPGEPEWVRKFVRHGSEYTLKGSYKNAELLFLYDIGLEVRNLDLENGCFDQRKIDVVADKLPMDLRHELRQSLLKACYIVCGGIYSDLHMYNWGVYKGKTVVLDSGNIMGDYEDCDFHHYQFSTTKLVFDRGC